MKNLVDWRRTSNLGASHWLVFWVVLGLLGGLLVRPVGVVCGEGFEEFGDSSEEYASDWADQYVSVEYEEADLGVRWVPEIDFAALGPNVAAEDFMQRIREIVSEQDTNTEATRDQYLAEGWDLSGFEDVVLMSTAMDLQDDVLSVAVRYTPFTLNEPIQYAYLSLNVDVRSGHLLTHEELMGLVGFEDSDVELFIRELGKQCVMKELRNQVLYQAANEVRIPEASELTPDLSPWEDMVEDCVDSYRAALERREDQWLRVPDPPAYFYTSSGELHLSVEVPTMAGAGFREVMVPLVKLPDEICMVGYSGTFGEELLGFGFVTPEAALDAVVRSFELDENGNTKEGVHLSFRLDSMQMLSLWEDRSEPTYFVEAYEDLGDHVAEYAWRYVSALNGGVYEYDIVHDIYEYMPLNLSSYDDYFVDDGQAHGALGIILRDIGPYDEFIYGPHRTADVAKLMGLDSGAYDADEVQMCLVGAIEDATVVSVEYGNRSGEWGVMDEVVYETTLNVGEILFVKYPADGANPIGVRVQNAGGESFYDLSCLENEPEVIVYLMAE